MLDHLLDELVAVFPPQPMNAEQFRPTGMLWAEYERLESFLAEIEGRSWDQLTPEFLELHQHELGSMPPRGFIAVLPAYLRACLAGDNMGEDLSLVVVSQLTREPSPYLLEEFDERVALLSAEQRLFIARVFAALLEHKLYLHRLDSLENALDSYWRSLLEPDFVATPRPMLEGGRFPLSEVYKQERDDLLAELARVFPAVPMRADMFGDPDGWWGDYSQAEAFMAEVSGRTWQELDPDFTERHDDPLIHMDPAGFIAVLPAYISSFALAGDNASYMAISLIPGLTRRARLEVEDVQPYMEADDYAAMLPESLVEILNGDQAAMAAMTRILNTPFIEETFDQRVALLSPEQCTVIARILDAALRHNVYRWIEDKLQAAFDSYWRSFLDAPARISAGDPASNEPG